MSFFPSTPAVESNPPYGNNNNKLFSSRMALVTSTITMINVVNAWCIMIRENRGETSKPYSEFYELYRNFVNKTKQKVPSCLR